MSKRFTARHVVYTIIGIAALVAVMYSSLVLRDYDIVFEDGLTLVSKTPVKAPPGFTLDTSLPEKLTVNIKPNGAEAYDIQISRFESMAFGKTYRTALPKKQQGLMKGGKDYYIRVRSVDNKPGTVRKVFGKWGAVRKATIKKSP